MKRILVLWLVGFVVACQSQEPEESLVVTQDIDNFWKAYDLIVQEEDSVRRLVLLDSIYIQRGSEGLRRMMEVKNYRAQEYVGLMVNYPKYWTSIRENTYQAQSVAEDLKQGIQQLKALYPDLKPAKIYFTMGAMRSNGTTQDSLVLIGSEFALADSLTDVSEFEGETRDWLEGYFATNPIGGIVLLNVHEYVHTQQQTLPDNLLHLVLYEGVAEFVSVTAMQVASNSPAIAYGKGNPAVREAFEREMFYERVYDWLWSSSPNAFGVRDLGYYIGYAIAEEHYQKAEDKQQAIKELIELDFDHPAKVDSLIDETGYFSKPIEVLRGEDSIRRPKVVGMDSFANGAMNVDPGEQEITLRFSEQLNGFHTGLNYSDMGEEAFPMIIEHAWSADSTTWTMKVDLKPQTRYRFWVTESFRTTEGVALMPYQIEFETK